MFLALLLLEKITQPAAQDNADLQSTLVQWKWPIMLLIALAIFYIPIKNLINRLKKGKIFGNEFETNEVQQQQSKAEKKPTNIDKALGLFREETINDFKSTIIKETLLNEVGTDKEKFELLFNYATVLYIKTHFENIYENIFGSQILLLQYLNSVLGVGDTYEKLKTFYDQAITQYPAAFDDYTYEEYFNFLITRSLVVASKDKYLITINGVDFLKYITEMGKSQTKKY